jgi:hypothetical protein
MSDALIAVPQEVYAVVRPSFAIEQFYAPWIQAIERRRRRLACPGGRKYRSAVRWLKVRGFGHKPARWIMTWPDASTLRRLP